MQLNCRFGTSVGVLYCFKCKESGTNKFQKGFPVFEFPRTKFPFTMSPVMFSDASA